MTQVFQFEQDFADSLRCVPMRVRYNLDTCGIKLKLTHWHALSRGDRQLLLDLPCQSEADIAAYRQRVYDLVAALGGDRPADLPLDPQPAWLDAHQIPDSVQQQGQRVGVCLTTEQWSRLDPLQRFALIKLSQSGHEHQNFLPALREFGVLESAGLEA
ncbi:nitrate reductase associated protein [Thermoleptolyngbya sp. C42_A2020_037]|uniref:nitrate reductase associated protein n=1 Tax=Thermoleptolyngbya sp. C42_A2020_037 TaxID=2747799 RepID=UPI0019FF93F9|nr:nitrate reductase associated protein [Thermoleptolyngbya sp. C42_A2020_037]MBF2083666.1 nitrate reductase associated protein [Thermoleptolyngbya sp. C42_A2020_037]